MKGLDYSSGRPDLKKAKALGYGFVIRYLFPPLKGATKAEATAIRAAGLGLVVVYESYAGRALEGQAAGAADGKTALAFARAIGFPDSRPLYFAVDFAGTAAQQPAIDAYLRGVGSVIYTARVGVYGSFGVIERCHASGFACWFWQTYAWSAGKVSAHAHLLQYSNGQTVAGALVDLNESRQFDFGAWEPVKAPVVVKPVVVAKPVVKPVVKPAIHIMTGAEMLAWVKNVGKPVVVVKPAVATPVTKPTIHIMTGAEMLAWMKNLVKK